MKISELRDCPEWLNKAITEGADVEYDGLGRVVWRGGEWRGGVWRGGVWRDDLTAVRDDFWAVLCSALREIPGLRRALVEGRVNGSVYIGECACLVGTIANVRGCDFTELGALKPNADRPAEQFFFSIHEGNTPENSRFAKQAVEWIDEFTNAMQAVFGTNASTNETA